MKHLLLLTIAILAAGSHSGCSSSSSAQGAIAISEPAEFMFAADVERLNSGQVIFVGHDEEDYFQFDYEPWVSDGTPEGTFRLLDILPGENGSLRTVNDGEVFVIVNEVAYFVADDDVNGTSLWSTDGTTAGTTREALLVPLPLYFAPRSMTIVGDQIFIAGPSRELGTNNIVQGHLFVIALD